MPKFRKKPVEIEAIRFVGHNKDAVENFVGRSLHLELESETAYVAGIAPPIFSLSFDTKEGIMKAFSGDWVIKEPFPTGDRDFYPCKPDIFAKTYEPAPVPSSAIWEGNADTGINCPSCGRWWNVSKNNACECGALLKPHSIEPPPIPQSENKIEGEPMDGYTGNTIPAIKCIHCGEPNQIYKNGNFRKNCWWCKEPLEDGKRIALRVNDVWQSPAPEPEVGENQEAPVMSDQLAAEADIAAIDFGRLAQRLEDESYDASELTDAYECGQNWMWRKLQDELSSLKDRYAVVTAEWTDEKNSLQAEIELLRKSGASLRPETSILIARIKKTEGRFMEGNIVELIPGLIDVDYYRIHNGPAGNESAKFAYSSVDIIGARCPGLTPHQEEDRLKAHAIAFSSWMLKGNWAWVGRMWASDDYDDFCGPITEVYDLFTADEANKNLNHKAE